MQQLLGFRIYLACVGSVERREVPQGPSWDPCYLQVTAAGAAAATLADMERPIEGRNVNSEDSWLLREAVHAPSLEVFNPQRDKALGNPL